MPRKIQKCLMDQPVKMNILIMVLQMVLSGMSLKVSIFIFYQLHILRRQIFKVIDMRNDIMHNTFKRKLF